MNPENRQNEAQQPNGPQFQSKLRKLCMTSLAYVPLLIWIMVATKDRREHFITSIIITVALFCKVSHI